MIDYKKIVEFWVQENVKEADYKIEVEDNESKTTVIVKLDKKDMGKMIGKNGNIISSIRNVINSISKIDNKKVIVLVKEI